MRILAIRGANLASLAHSFEVDFTAEPLRSAGLFAIAGPTGAGKSTLLDALCLALFDNTPRLLRASPRDEIPDVGERNVRSADSRNLLRRGAAEGFAEVDFSGSDGIAYRARWSVRRARGKAAGNLQSVDMSLLSLPGLEAVAGPNKTEVRDAIQQRLGLSFEQFTRAVLLAQNEFFAFLKAGDDERAALLQTLTGTDLFESLSKRAFERHRDEMAALQRLEDQLGSQAPLDAAARQQLEAEIGEADSAVQAVEQRRQAAEARVQAFDAVERATAAVVEANQGVAVAEAQRTAAASRQKYFRVVERVHPARPLQDEALRLQRECGATGVEVTRTAAALAEARARLGEADDVLLQARRVREEQSAQRLALAPLLAQARRFDGELQGLQARQRDEAQARLEAREAHRRLLAELQTLKKQQQEEAGKVASLGAWIAAHAAYGPLGDGWGRWQTLFADALELVSRHRSVQVRMMREADAGQQLRQALTQAEAVLASASLQLEQHEARCLAAEQRLAGLDGDRLAQQRVCLETRRDALAQALQGWQNLGVLQQQQAGLDEQQQHITARLEAGVLRQQQLGERLPALEQAHAQAEAVCTRVAAACHASVESLRAGLLAGEPCPVCGACEHPYATEASHLHELLRDLRLERDGHAKSLAQARGEAEALQQTQTALQQERASCQSGLDALAPRLRQAREAWGTLATALPEAAADEGGREETLKQALAACGEGLQQLGREEAALREARRALDIVRQERDAARERGHEARRRRDAALEAMQRQAQLLQQLEQQLAGVVADLDVRLEGLDEVLNPALGAGWREAWDEDGAAFVAARAREAQEWTTRCEALRVAQRQLEVLEVRAESLPGRLYDSKAKMEALVQRCTQLEQQVVALQVRRSQLFATGPWEGLGADEIEGRAEAALQGALTREQAATQQQQRAASALAAAASADEQQRARLGQVRTASLSADAALQDWLTGHPDAEGLPLSREALEALLAHDAAWLGAEREALQSLEQAVADARTVLQERASYLAQARAALPEVLAGVERTVLEAERAQAVQEMGLAHQHRATLKARLAEDEQRRQQCAALLQGIVTQQAHSRLWAQMNDLVGHHEGRKFRNFAQQLTLDLLLAYANRQLEVLARRYRLERVRDSLGLQVVDQDMGDEVRSVHSLSGGESFLLSLALALGLASLSSHRVRVESLFIDEGFGSLDADTLRVAMDALDSLQAQGRKVGVISHVQDMTERIGVRVMVTRGSGGASRVSVAG